MFGTDAFTGLFGKVKKQLITPQFAPSSTNINPYRNGGTVRLRHFKKPVPRRLRLPGKRYSKSELNVQQEVVANYHKLQDPKYRKRMEGRARAIAMHAERKLMDEHIANRPTVEA